MTTLEIPPGARLLSIRRTGEKLSRSRSWVWDKIKSDPDFPKPIRLAGEPVLLEHEVDHYIALVVAKSREPAEAAPKAQRGRRSSPKPVVAQEAAP